MTQIKWKALSVANLFQSVSLLSYIIYSQMKHLSHFGKFHYREEMEMAIRKWLPIEEHDLKLVLSWQKYITVLRDYRGY